MQKIFSVNELKGHLYVQTTALAPCTGPPATGRIVISYIQGGRRSTALRPPAGLGRSASPAHSGANTTLAPRLLET